MEPSDLNYTCGHPDAGTFGVYTHRATAKDGHCGPERSKFKQHPLRNANGTLKMSEQPWFKTKSLDYPGDWLLQDAGNSRWELRKWASDKEPSAAGSQLAVEAAKRLLSGQCA